MTGPSHNRLAVLAIDIRAAHLDVTRGALAVAERAIATGNMLIEAKASVAHGEWGAWLQDRVGMSARTARRYMQISRSGVETATVADIGIRASVERLARLADGVPLPPPGHYALAINYAEASAAVWRCPIQPDRFHVAVYRCAATIEHEAVAATRHPVPDSLLPATVSAAGFSLGSAAFRLLPAEDGWPDTLRAMALGEAWR